MALPGGDHVSSFWECATGCFWVHSPALLVWTWKSQVYMTTEIGNHKIILLIFLIPNWNYYLKWQTLTIYVKFECKGWPARSPDLTVPDFFLRGFLKDRVFWRRIVTIQELKKAIVDEVAAIDDLRRRVYGNFQTRSQQCIDVNGGHLPDVIFRKLTCNLWVINSILGRIYRRFRKFFPFSVYYLWPFEMCQSAPRHLV